MKKQGLNVTIKELKDLIKDLEEQYYSDEDTKFLIGIINKTPECSDTWEIE